MEPIGSRWQRGAGSNAGTGPYVDTKASNISSRLFTNEPPRVCGIVGNHGKTIFGATRKRWLIFLGDYVLGEDEIKSCKGRYRLRWESLDMLEDNIESNICFNSFVIMHDLLLF
jgi:hypothetical protein